MAKDNFYLGEIFFENLTLNSTGITYLVSEFSVDTNGILTVTTYEEENEHKRNTVILDSSVVGQLDKEEVQACLEKSKEMEVEDRKEEERGIARAHLECFCWEMQLKKKEVEELELIK